VARDDIVTLFAAFVAVFLILWAILYALLPLTRRGRGFGASFMARFSARYSRIPGFADWARAYGPIVLIVIGGAMLTGWAGDTFLDLAEEVHSHSPKLQRIDSVVHAWAISHRSPGATTFFATMSTIGGPVGLAALVLGVIVVLLLLRRFQWILYLAVTVGGGALLNQELKRYFERARPDLAEMLRQAHGYSFPSGHAMGSTVVFGALSYLAFRTATQWRWKAAVVALGATIVLAVSLSRIYLGAHWISDVVAGIAAGTLWVVLSTMAYETLRRIRLLRAIQREARSSVRAARGA
jgi:undecaprenyl-diphosphatase